MLCGASVCAQLTPRAGGICGSLPGSVDAGRPARCASSGFLAEPGSGSPRARAALRPRRQPVAALWPPVAQEPPASVVCQRCLRATYGFRVLKSGSVAAFLTFFDLMNGVVALPASYEAAHGHGLAFRRHSIGRFTAFRAPTDSFFSRSPALCVLRYIQRCLFCVVLTAKPDFALPDGCGAHQ